jgi:hypothetical protein
MKPNRRRLFCDVRRLLHARRLLERAAAGETLTPELVAHTVKDLGRLACATASLGHPRWSSADREEAMTRLLGTAGMKYFPRRAS